MVPGAKTHPGLKKRGLGPTGAQAGNPGAANRARNRRGPGRAPGPVSGYEESGRDFICWIRPKPGKPQRPKANRELIDYNFAESEKGEGIVGEWIWPGRWKDGAGNMWLSDRFTRLSIAGSDSRGVAGGLRALPGARGGAHGSRGISPASAWKNRHPDHVVDVVSPKKARLGIKTGGPAPPQPGRTPAKNPGMG